MDIRFAEIEIVESPSSLSGQYDEIIAETGECSSTCLPPDPPEPPEPPEPPVPDVGINSRWGGMIPTSRTQIWCVVDDELVQVGCVTSFQPPSKTYSTRDRTGLEDVIDRQEGGGRLSFGPINLTAIIKDESMKAIFDGSTVRDWIVGLGDGTAQPTLSGGVITMYKTRSWHYFDAIITSESHDAIAPNEVLRGSYEGIVANYADYSIKSEDDDTTIQVPWQTNIPWQTDTYWR